MMEAASEALAHPAADALGAVRAATVSMRELAKVIRKYGTCAPAALELVASRIEAALAQAPAENAAAKHWHDLYRRECQLRQDDAARYGQQIVDLEAQAPAVRGNDVLLRVSDEDLRWCKDTIAALQETGGPTNNMRAVGLLRLVTALEAALGQGKGS